MTLPAVELSVFVSSWLTNLKGSQLHPEAAYKLSTLLADLSDWLALHPEQDRVVFMDSLTELLGWLSDGKWEDEQDPRANWVPDSDLVIEQLRAEGVVLKAQPLTARPGIQPYPQLKQLVVQAALSVLEDVTEFDLLDDKAFYTPKEWVDRGEEHGCNSCLILVHDGGWFSYLLNLDHEAYALYDAFQAALSKLLPDYHFEQCTSWYSALYCDL